MPYSALPAARRRHYEIDGTVVGANFAGSSGDAYIGGLTTIYTSGQMLALNEESPTVDSLVGTDFSSGTRGATWFLFPEVVDLSYFMARFASTDGGTAALSTLQSSVDTTTGIDGTWNTVSFTGTPLRSLLGVGGDWWRSTIPATLTSNNTGIKGLRFQVTTNSGGAGSGWRNYYLWGTKHSGQTPDDIIFLESDGTTEWPNDDDWGDLNAGSAAVTHTYYVKNTSPTKTANTITVKSSGSDHGKWDVSLDNVSFASSKSIASLVAGATQVVYFRFTPPAAAAGVYRPNAAYLEADVTSWT